jgi:hypothetical protein
MDLVLFYRTPIARAFHNLLVDKGIGIKSNCFKSNVFRSFIESSICFSTLFNLLKPVIENTSSQNAY